MKNSKILLCLLAPLLPVMARAQGNVRFKLDYDPCSREYVAKIVPLANIAATPVSAGSQFTVIFPGTTSPNNEILTTPGTFGLWSTSTASEGAYTTGGVFYKTWISGGSLPVAFTAGIEYELFRFRYTTPGVCVAGLRLMNNSTDPIDAGTPGLDYSNYWLYNAGQTDYYSGNVSNAAAACTQSDFGDLSTATWPVANAGMPVASCLLSGNVPAAWNAATNPVTTVWAGTQISGDSATIGNGNVTATTDNFDDGMTAPAGNTTVGAPLNFNVSLNANRAATTVHYRVWIDWNADGNFANDNNFNGTPATFQGSAVVATAGTPVIASFVTAAPSGVSANYAIRLAVSDAAIADVYRGAGGPTSVLNLTGGEIEDYTANTVLPVALLSFDAAKDGGNARLNWTSAQEHNSKEFIIERQGKSTSDWTVIGTVAAAGNSDTKRSYQFVDTKVMADINQYRLKLMDKDGSFNYSEIRMVRFGSGKVISVYPNPSQGNIVVSGLEAGDRMVLSDLSGRITLEKVSANGTETIDLGAYAPGTYMLTINSNTGERSTTKIVKQ